MNFASDNAYGAVPQILDALNDANEGPAASYGNDEITARLNRDMSRLFERDVAVFPVVTGTAANALALATLVPPHGAIVCDAQAHIVVDECGAPEFFTHGARLVAIEGEHGKLSVPAIEAGVARLQVGAVHHSQPAAISLTQATECGTCYRVDEIAAIAALARRRGMKLHMDGARFANALANLRCTPAEATWRAGVDVLSFGASKNGALCAEAVVFFDPDDIRDFEYRRKKSGHLPSKMRFLSAQLTAYLEEGRWLKTAAHANTMAARLAKSLSAMSDAEIAYPVEANAVFVRLSDETISRLRAAGAQFYDWAPSANGRTLVRLITSHATPESDVERFLAVARG